jgi:hypothetical protein
MACLRMRGNLGNTNGGWLQKPVREEEQYSTFLEGIQDQPAHSLESTDICLQIPRQAKTLWYLHIKHPFHFPASLTPLHRTHRDILYRIL